jgi:hypothetical protein
MDLLPLTQAAALGALYGNIARMIPGIAALRVANPTAYDAILSAAVVASLQRYEEERQPLPPINPNNIIPPPNWTRL